MTRLDPEAIASLKSFGDPGFLAEVVDIYVADTPLRVEAMRSAIAEGDAATLAAAAHALKSSSGNIGATAVREICAEIEANVLDGASERLAALEQEFADAVEALREIVESGNP